MPPNQAQSQLLWIEKANLLTLITGIVLSAYGLFVELKHEHNSSYEAMCDVSETISCTKALSSSWATGLGLVEPLLGKDHFLNQKNALYGVIGYALLMPLQFNRSRLSLSICWVVAIVFNLTSVYLFCILVYLKTVCLVCYGIYAINAIFLLLTMKRRSLVKKANSRPDKEDKKKRN